ncbi:MAG: hypothetical protein AAFQ57_13810 [Cyanobacteria bacterium J06626_14]
MRRFRYIVLAVLTTLMLLSLSADSVSSQDAYTADEQAIIEIVTADFDNDNLHNLSVTVDPVLIVDDVAIAVWLYGEMGGMYIFVQEEGQWRSRCASGGVLNAESMQKFCDLSADQATKLWNAWVELEENQ